MRAHFLQHVAFEDLGSIAAWLDARGATLGTTRFHLGETPPDVGGLDLLVIGGGPMSVNDEAVLPWLIAEKRFVRDTIARGIPVLGVCLGAQLIASSLGARVYPNADREIGWFPIHAVPASADCFAFPAESTVFHWHGETFDLPPHAMRLASSAGCTNQGFQIGRNVMGLQFHLETTPESARALVEHCRDEMTLGPYVQSADVVLAAPPERYAAINALMAEVLRYLVR